MPLGTGGGDPLRVIDRDSLAPGRTPLGPAIRQAHRNLTEMDRLLDRAGFVDSEYAIPSKQVIGGQISNIQAAIYQASRHTKETIVEITSGPASSGEVASWLAGLKGNRGHFALSVVSHVRAAQRLGIWEMIQARVSDPRQRITHISPIIPRSSEGHLRPQGILMRYLGIPFRVQDWIRIARGHNKKRGGLSLAFSLGLHHGDLSYLAPITAAKLPALALALAAYRKRLRKRVRGPEQGDQ